MAQIQKAQERKIEWEKELEMTQRLRDKKKELYARARQRMVDELEAEAELWLTNEEEVEKALGNPIAGQRLWVRPGSIIGAPSGAVSLCVCLFCIVLIYESMYCIDTSCVHTFDFATCTSDCPSYQFSNILSSCLT